MNGMKRSCFTISPEFGRPTNIPVRVMARAKTTQPTHAAMIMMAAALAVLTFWVIWLA